MTKSDQVRGAILIVLIGLVGWAAVDALGVLHGLGTTAAVVLLIRNRDA